MVDDPAPNGSVEPTPVAYPVSADSSPTSPTSPPDPPESLDPSQLAESSRSAQKRLLRLSRLSTTSLIHFPSAAFDPLSSTLIYPPADGGHHRLSSVFASEGVRPRRVPLAPVTNEQGIGAVSPDGEWMLTFLKMPDHTSRLEGEVGKIFVYTKTGMLSPSTTPLTIMPQASQSMSSVPLAIQFLYPPRTHLDAGVSSTDTASTYRNKQGRAPPLGPRPLASHAPDQGPTALVVTDNQLLLMYPQPVPIASAPVPAVQWTIPALRCSLETSCRVDHNTPVNPRPPRRADRAWTSLVSGSQGVWIALEKDGVVSFIRVDVGRDLTGNIYLDVTLLPPAPRLYRDNVVSTLEHVAFIKSPLPPAPNGTSAQSNGENGSHSLAAVEEAVSVILTYTDRPSGISEKARARVEVVQLSHGEIDVIGAFGEVGTGQGETTQRRWITGLESTKTFTAPDETTVLALSYLPDVPPHTLAVALLSTPRGPIATYLDFSKSSSTWPVVGEQRLLKPQVYGRVSLFPSQGVLRGGLGLLAIAGDNAFDALLVPSPDMSREKGVERIATRAANTIFAAMKQEVDWSDTVRAAFGLVATAKDRKDLGEKVIRKVHELVRARGRVNQVLRAQIAVWSMIKDSRLGLAVELVRIIEACRVFQLVATPSGTFDLNSVWNLVDVFEWSVVTMGKLLRDAILEQPFADWRIGDVPACARGESSLIFVVHPMIRRLLIDLLDRLDQYAKFISTLERPILPPTASMLLARDPRVTSVAKERVEDILLREAVDLNMWRETLRSINHGPLPPSTLEESLITFRTDPISSIIPQITNSIPSPSALFLAPSIEDEPEIDGVTFAPLPDRGPKARCDRCGYRTALVVQNTMRGDVASPWSAWVRLWRVSCVCGGTWMRE